MNERERFTACMTGGTPDRPSNGDYMCYDSTRSRWEKEGLPKEADLFRYFNFDHIDIWDEDCVPYNWNFGDLYDTVKISEDHDHEIWRDHDGSVVKYRKNYEPPFMPKHESYPVYDRKSWNAYRKKIIEKRSAFKVDISKDISDKWRNRTTPLGIWAGSSYGIIRNWCGVEQLSYLLYDDPVLVSGIVEFLTDIYTENFIKAIKMVDPDWVMFWEDMAYNHGPLVSPEMYLKIFVPFYKRMMPLVEKAGIRVVMLDCDGKIDELIPIWLDLGINTMHPMEAASGMNVIETRRRFGTDIKFYGGIDKRELSKGREEIDAEVLPKLKAMEKGGGFIAACDHAVPPDISFDNFCYYRGLIKNFYEG